MYVLYATTDVPHLLLVQESPISTTEVKAIVRDWARQAQLISVEDRVQRFTVETSALPFAQQVGIWLEGDKTWRLRKAALGTSSWGFFDAPQLVWTTLAEIYLEDASSTQAAQVMSELRQQITDLLSKLDSKSSALEEAGSELERLYDVANQLEVSNQLYQLTAKSTNNRLVACEQDLTTAQSEQSAERLSWLIARSDLEQELAVLQETLAEKITDSEKETNRLQKQIQERVRENEQIKVDNVTLRSTIAELEDRLDHLIQRQALLQGISEFEHQILSDRVQGLEKQLSAATSANADLNALIAQLSAEIQDFEKLASRIKQLEEEQVLLQSGNAKLSDVALELQFDLQQTASALSDAKSENRKLLHRAEQAEVFARLNEVSGQALEQLSQEFSICRDQLLQAKAENQELIKSQEAAEQLREQAFSERDQALNSATDEWVRMQTEWTASYQAQGQAIKDIEQEYSICREQLVQAHNREQINQDWINTLESIVDERGIYITENKQLKEQIQAQHQLLQVASAEINSLKRALESQAHEKSLAIEQLKEKDAELQRANVEQLQRRIEFDDAWIEQVTKSLEEQESDCRFYRCEMEHLAHENQSFAQQRDEAMHELNRLSMAQQDTACELDQKRARVKELESLVRKLERDLANVAKLENELLQQNMQKDWEIADLKNALCRDPFFQ